MQNDDTYYGLNEAMKTLLIHSVLLGGLSHLLADLLSGPGVARTG